MRIVRHQRSAAQPIVARALEDEILYVRGVEDSISEITKVESVVLQHCILLAPINAGKKKVL